MSRKRQAGIKKPSTAAGERKEVPATEARETWGGTEGHTIPYPRGQQIPEVAFSDGY